MQEKQLPVNVMISQMTSELDRLGYHTAIIWERFYKLFRAIEIYHIGKERIYYDPDVTEEYLQLQRERVERGEIHLHHYSHLKTAARRMNDFYMTGTFHVPQVTRGTRYVVSEQNEYLISEFIEWKGYGPNTREDVGWVLRRYFYYLEHLGYKSISEVSIDEVRTFLLKMASEMKTSSLHNLVLYLRHFHIFLKEKNYHAPDCVALFSYKVFRELPVQSYVTDEELCLVLRQIDRTTVAGKRNYAIIQLAATTGMRAADIIRLKLTDINWRKGEIKIVQKKTGNTTHLPIIKDAGEALLDYILNARPKSDCPEVFLRTLPPTVALTDAVAIGYMFKSYQKKAGIERHPFDGKGFHGLRRRMAKKLIVNGTPLTTIAQILGHTEPSSARQYISLDTSNLKECALDFKGISYGGV